LALTTRALAGRLPGGVEAIELDTIEDRLAVNQADAPASGVHPQNLSHVIFTSGSTGRPKGVMIRHAATAALLHWMREAVPHEERACVLASTSVSFDVSVAEIFGTLCWGGTLVLVENALDLPSVADAGVRSACMVPSAAAELLRSGGIPAGVRALNLAGEPLPPELARGLYALGTVETVRNLYGPTEDTSYSTCAVVPRGAGRVRIGRPLAGTRAHVLDAALRPAPVGVAGELYLSGAGLARGYEARPGLTAESFLPDPHGPPGSRMYRTRDRARWTAEGELEYLGRVDLQVKVRGYRIEPGEVEAALRAHASVADAVAIVREDAPGDRRLVAYLVSGDGVEAPPAAELRAHLRSRLPEYMVPAAFVRVDALPRTPSGKVDRKALPAPEISDPQTAYVAPRTPAEEVLAAIFAQVLSAERVGAHDDFFAAGGHSLLAMRAAARVRDAFGVELPLRALFEAPTVAALAPRIAALRDAGGSVGAPPLVPVPREGPLPLSFAQQRLWFLHQMDPAGSAYHMQAGLRLRGALDIPALERSLSAIAARHEALRTRFPSADGEPVQVIDSPSPVAIHVIDLHGLDEKDTGDSIRWAMEDEAACPFDLAGGPLIRATLLRLGDEDHALIVTLHHVIGDGWSTGVLVREATELYSAYTSGREPNLPPLPVQYADYAVWQRAWLGGGQADAQVAWWRERLAGAPPVLELPVDRPRPAVPSGEGGTVPFVLLSRTADALRALSRAEGATLFMTLLAAWQLLLSRHGAGDDMPVGTPVAGRGRVEVEGLIGFFVNTLVLRTDLSGDPPFRALLGRVREATLGAFAHQEIPFESLVEALAPERSAGRTPLFQVMLALQNQARETVRLGELVAEPLEPASIAAKFDLSLSLAEEGGALSGALTYRADLFDAATAEHLLARWRTLLEGIAADPGAALSRVPMLGAAERRQLLETWNDSALDVDPTPLVHQLFEVQAARTPGAPAVLYGTEALTFAELDARANRLAHHLRRLGVGPDARVGVCLERGVELIVGILGTWKAGGAYLPLDPAHPAERLLGVLDDADARVVVTASAAAERLDGYAGHVVRLDGDAERIGRERDDAPEVPVSAENLAYVIYTSGSTGRPRGVMVEHRSVANLSAALDRAVYAPRGGDAPPRVSVNGPATFDTSVKQIVQLLRGAALCIIPENARRDAVALGAVLREQAVEVLDCTPAQLRHLLEDGLLDAAGPALTDLLVAGEAIDPGLWRALAALPGRRAWNLYGPTECTVDAALCRVAGERPVLGGPVANARLYVLGAAGEPVPAGVPGELHVGGAGVARGYVGKPGMTAERFIPDPFSGVPGARLYRTGDRVRWTAEAALEYLGRTDFQVKVRGFRIEPGEVEAALDTHPAVARSVVVAREDGAAERRLVAYAVVRADTNLPAAPELRAHLAQRLPEYMVPAAIVVLDALPLTANGKVDRRALPAPELPEESFAAPATPAEEILAGIFAQVLHLDRVGAHDDFFALGGHSLLATRLVSRVRDALGVELPLRALFEAPTPAGLAARVAASSTDGESAAGQAPPLARVRRDGPLPLSFAQQRLWFIDQLEPGSAAYNLSYAVRLRGAVDVAALERSLAEVARRHEALRTRFPSADGEPVQVIGPPAPVALAAADLSSSADAEDALRALCASEALRPFDLAAGPLLRGTLARLGEGDHALLLTLHHIVSDGWSTGVLVRELSALYTAFSRGEPSPLAELPLQYADYAAWQRARLSGPILDAQLEWWRETLRDAPPLLEIPTDHPRPPIADGRAGTVRFAFTAAQADALRALARREGATLFMTLLAGWQLLLSRYAGQDDVSVGTPIAGRTRLETEGLIGLFVNTLVLRTKLGGAPTFRDVLRWVREATLGAFQHQELPFERLVEALVQGRALGHTPLFQAMLILQNNAREALRLGSLEATVLESAGAAAKFDLMLVVLEDEERLDGELTYRADLFEPHTAARMVEHLRVLLDEMAADAARPVASVELLRGAEREQVLGAWNATDAGYAADRLIHRVIEEQAARTPESVAVSFGDDALTYRELDERANRLAHALARLGAGPEARVGICLERSAEMVVAVLGVLKAGAAYVPLDAAYPPARLAYMLDDSAAQILVTQQSLTERLPADRFPLVLIDGPIDGAREGDASAAPPPSSVAP
ncbi:MAG TPA: amino acid adenylation domain-containing protein, partial [Longimicrobium sp.]|nr:amino acid adenylation domain-containing protein [Longimicrobium sp.]